MADYIGYMAAFLGTICWLPQLYKIWKTKETKDLSLWTNLLFFLALSLWLAYGFLLGAWPIIVANTISLLFVGSILTAKLIYK